ncbi:hypothetical protein M9435_003303 [Picochlorum sp. BPE23]|nr:hypothetical protein M9435_003303 [Picochlorum sp. BPE23]
MVLIPICEYRHYVFLVCLVFSLHIDWGRLGKMGVKKGANRRSKRLQVQNDEDTHEELEARDLELSSSEDEDELATSAAVEVDDAILDYQTALERHAGRHAEGSDSEDDFYNNENGEDDDEDSSDEERPQRNTVGEVPLEWYSDEEHIGYDTKGQKIVKKERKDKLDELLDKNDSSLAWRTVYDKYNDEEIVLSKEEIRMIQNIRAGRFAHSDVDPYPDENDWFSRHREVMPLSAAPEPKSRFTPSKWEEKKVVKLVRAIRKGWLSTKPPPKKPDVYLLWDQESDELNKTMAGLTYLAAPKMKLPGHDESYNPPKEYLMTEEERNTAELEAEEANAPPPFIPQAFDALRKVPAYERYINERFERCLDLYLCPRSRVKRMDISDPESLVPKLPKPKELQPFPTILSIKYMGHSSKVTSISVHPTGQWLMSGSKDASVRLWEVSTGRCMCTWTFESPVQRVAWCPKTSLTIISVACEKRLYLIPVKLNTFYEASVEMLQASIQGGQETTEEDKSMPATWSWAGVESQGSKVQSVAIEHSFDVKDIAWHNGGDYFCTTCPKGNTKAVLVHQLSKGVTQNPFKKNRGIVTRALFHPTKPFFFVATQQAVRIYNLAKQSLAKKLVSGSGVITSMSIHSSGDHVILGGEDKRVCWYDLDLSSKPYKALRYHDLGVRAVSFHPTYPLFASGSDDGTTHVFHGRVFADLMTNPMIVPVKILRGHQRVNAEGVTDVVFHPKQPWAFTAGADGAIYLHVNP